MDVQQLFGARVRSLRRKLDLTQQGLGERAGVNYKYVGQVERGEVNPSLDVISRLAGGLGVEMADLFDMEHEERDEAILREKIEAALNSATGAELRMALGLVRALRA